MIFYRCNILNNFFDNSTNIYTNKRSPSSIIFIVYLYPILIVIFFFFFYIIIPFSIIIILQYRSPQIQIFFYCFSKPNLLTKICKIWWFCWYYFKFDSTIFIFFFFSILFDVCIFYQIVLDLLLFFFNIFYMLSLFFSSVINNFFIFSVTNILISDDIKN